MLSRVCFTRGSACASVHSETNACSVVCHAISVGLFLEEKSCGWENPVMNNKTR